MSEETLLLEDPISVQKQALSGETITLITSEDAEKALKDRWLELWATYEIWKNKWWNRAEATVKIEWLSGWPSGIQKWEESSWVEERIKTWWNNISIWTSDDTGKIGNMWYLNDFRADPRWGALTVFNGTEFYFEKIEEGSVRDKVADVISQ